MSSAGDGKVGGRGFAGCYRSDAGRLYVFRAGGVFELVDGRWDWHPRDSHRWNAAHQAAFRNSRMDACELPDDAPEIPEPPLRKNTEEPSRSRFPVPRAVADWVRARGGRGIAVILLEEDEYESLLGDGKFHYAVGCFPSEQACDDYLERHGKRQYSYHRRQLELVEQHGEVEALRVVEGHWADRISVPEMLRDLEKRLGRR